MLERYYFKSNNPLTPDLYVSGVDIVEADRGKKKIIPYFDQSCEELSWTSKRQWAKSVSDRNEAIILYNRMKAFECPVKLVCCWWCFGWHEEEVI